MAKSALLGSSLAKKYWMALTGLFLCTFLVAHLAGNLQLLGTGEAARLQFNAYAKFMTSFPLIKVLSYVTYFSILFHAVDGLMLAVQNKAARPVKYAHNRPGANSIWASRNMALLGTILLVFIVTHMSNFWYVMHWGVIGTDSAGNKDLYEVVMTFFRDPAYGLVFTMLYVLAMAAMGFHLWHGFASGFQSLGLRHPRYLPLIQKTGSAFAILVSGLFAIIPLIIHFTHA